MLSFQLICLLMAGAGADLDDAKPEIVPLDARYRHQPRMVRAEGRPAGGSKDRLQTGWFLEGPRRVGDYVVVELQEATQLVSAGIRIGPPRRPLAPEWSGLLAINLKSRAAFLLAPRRLSPVEAVRTAVSQYWGIENNRCAVIVTTYRVRENKEWHDVESQAWEWNLDRNECTATGPWTEASTLASILDTQQVDVVLADREPCRRTVEIRERTGPATISIPLNSPMLLNTVPDGSYACHGDAIIPQAGGRTFILYRPPDVPDFGKNWETGFAGWDTRRVNGRRWSLRAHDIEAATGGELYVAEPVRGLAQNQLVFGMYVATFSKQKERNQHFLLLVDGATGKITAQAELPFDRNRLQIDSPLLSPAGDWIAYLNKDIPPEERVFEEAQDDDNWQQTCELMIVDVKTGTVSSRTNLGACCSEWDSIVAADNKTTIWIYDSNRIRRLSIGAAKLCEEFFKLDPSVRDDNE